MELFHPYKWGHNLSYQFTFGHKKGSHNSYWITIGSPRTDSESSHVPVSSKDFAPVAELEELLHWTPGDFFQAPVDDKRSLTGLLALLAYAPQGL